MWNLMLITGPLDRYHPTHVIVEESRGLRVELLQFEVWNYSVLLVPEVQAGL